MSRTAAAAALLLVAEAGLVAGGGAAVAAAPQAAEEALLRSHQPSKEEILASDMAWAARHAKGSKAWAILEAEKTGKKVVATDETTETTYTVANPDGTLTTELTAGPERVLRDGKWQKVVATLARGTDGGVRAKNHPEGRASAARAVRRLSRCGPRRTPPRATSSPSARATRA